MISVLAKRMRLRSADFRRILKHVFKVGPEPLEKEIHEILGSKCEDRFS